MRQSTRVHIRRGLEVLSETDVPGRATVELWRETGRRRARQGVPMELVLNAYTLGSRILWQALIEIAADHADRRRTSCSRPARRCGPRSTCRTP